MKWIKISDQAPSIQDSPIMCAKYYNNIWHMAKFEYGTAIGWDDLSDEYLFYEMTHWLKITFPNND